MQELIKEVLAAIGGGAVAIVILLKLFKGIIEKYIDTMIATSAEKNIEKLKNKFARNMSAYEFLIKKEFEYYEKIDSIYAELIVIVQDISQGLCNKNKFDLNKNSELLAGDITRYVKLTMQLKNYIWTYQAYVPKDIFSIASGNVKVLQEKVDIINNCLMEIQKSGDYLDEKDERVLFYEDILAHIAIMENAIKNRLETLSAE